MEETSVLLSPTNFTTSFITDKLYHTRLYEYTKTMDGSQTLVLMGTDHIQYAPVDENLTLVCGTTRSRS